MYFPKVILKSNKDKWDRLKIIISVWFSSVAQLCLTLCDHVVCQSATSRKTLGWKKHKLESRLPGRNINNLRYADDTTLMAESKEELKSLLMKVKEES